MINKKEIEENKFGGIIRVSLILLWLSYYLFVTFKLAFKLEGEWMYWYSIPFIVLGYFYVFNWLINARFNIKFKVIK